MGVATRRLKGYSNALAGSRGSQVGVMNWTPIVKPIGPAIEMDQHVVAINLAYCGSTAIIGRHNIESF